MPKRITIESLGDSDGDDIGADGIDLSENQNSNYEVDSEEEEEYGKRKRSAASGKRLPQKKRSLVSSLIHMEAREDSEDEDEEEFGGVRQQTERTDEDLEYERMVRQQDARRAGQYNILEDPMDKIVEQLKQRNAQDRKQEKKYKQLASTGAIISGSSSMAMVSRAQPTMMDKVYVCKVNGSGKERMAVITLMNKLMHLRAAGKPSAVSSVFSNTTRNVVYIESKSEIAAKELITGMRNLKVYSMSMVPVEDLTGVLTVKGLNHRAASLVPGSWVRIKRMAVYKGDIGRVVALTAGGVNAIVQLEPRLDYAAIEEEYRCDPMERAAVRKELKLKAKTKSLPTQKPFDSAALSASDAAVELSRSRFPHAANIESWRDAHEQFYVFEGNYYLNGFLYKEVNIERTLDVSDVMPSIEQVHRFLKPPSTKQDDDYDEPSNADEELEHTELVAKAIESAGTSRNVVVSFGRGDKARVSSGDMVGLIGKVLTIDLVQRVVKLEILPLSGQEALAGRELDFSADDLSKHINVGAHVKVIDGIYAGQTGSVVKIDPTVDQAFVFTDLVPREIEVRLRDLQESSEVTQGLNELGGYRLYDLVNIEANVGGIVVNVGREDLTVLDSYGAVRSMKPAQVRGLLNRQSANAKSFDKDSNQISENSMVSILAGHQKQSSQNIVKRIFKTNLFLFSKQRHENAGVVLIRARDVRVMGSKGTAPFSENYMGKLDQPNKTGGKGGKGGGKGGKPALMGKTCKVKKGLYKGLIGVCVNATESHVKIELSAKHKVVTFKMNDIAEVKDDGTDPNSTDNRGNNTWGNHNEMTPYLAGQTPMMGSQTPMYGSTPMPGGASPGRSDIWQPGVGDTPMHSFDPFDGSATPTQNSFGGHEEYDPNAAAVGYDPLSSSSSSSSSQVFDAQYPWIVRGAEVLYQGRYVSKVMSFNETARTVSIQYQNDNSVHEAQGSELTPIVPREGDNALAFAGDYSGSRGSLDGIEDDGEDGILKVTVGDEDDFAIVQMSELVKLANW